MQIDLQADRAMIGQTRSLHVRSPHVRRPWLQLLAAVMELAGKQAELLRHAETPWASATFTGSRHNIALAFTGEEAAALGELFITALPEHEFTVPRQIVADASVTGVEHLLVPEPKLTVEFELLLLEEG